MNIVDMINQYGWVAGLVVLGAALAILKRSANKTAKVVALHYLAVAEKMVFADGDAKLAYVTATAYKALPVQVQMLIPMAMFELLVANLYRTVEEHVNAAQANLEKQTDEQTPAAPQTATESK